MNNFDLGPTEMGLVRAIQRNARRRHESAPTSDELHAFVGARPRRCRYCDLDESDLNRLRIHDQFGRAVVRHLAVRIDTLGSFELSNLCWTCVGCANVRRYLGDAGALTLGRHIAEVWRDRFGAS
jgi:hypothetical protein